MAFSTTFHAPDPKKVCKNVCYVSCCPGENPDQKLLDRFYSDFHKKSKIQAKTDARQFFVKNVKHQPPFWQEISIHSKSFREYLNWAASLRASSLGAYVLSKFKIKVQVAHNNTYYTTRILTQGQWKSFQGLRLGGIRIEGDVSNPIPFKLFPASTYRSILTIFVQKVVGQYFAVHL